MFEGYWVSPKGEVLATGRNTTHIKIVISNPKKFGETKQRIEKNYEKYGEGLTWEGKARDEIMTRIIKRGWVRIRERANEWTVQIWKLTPKMNDILWAWSNNVIKQVNDKYAPINIYELSKNMRTKSKSISFIDLSSGKSVSENVEVNTKDVKIVNNVDELSDIDYPPEFDDTDLNESINKYI